MQLQALRPVLTPLVLLLAPLGLASAQACGHGSGSCQLPRWTPDGVGEARLGESVELDGDTAVASATDQGQVYVYRRDGAHWAQAQVLDDPHAGDNGFGEELELDGDWLFVGAPEDDVHEAYGGVMHVYERIDGLFQWVTTLHDPNPDDFSAFGGSADRDGDWLVVASPGATPGQVHVYHRLGTGWSLRYSVGGAVWSFGSALSIRDMGAGTARLFVGAPFDHTQGGQSGAAHYYRLTLENFSGASPIRPLEVSSGDWFGADLAFDGEQLFVSAPGDDDLGENSGAVYVFNVSADLVVPTMTLVDKLLPCATGGYGIGTRLDRDGKRLIVSAVSEGLPGEPGGAAYLFRPDPFSDGWVFDDRLVAADGVPTDAFGFDVAVSGSAAFVGSPWVEELGVKRGAAYLFSLSSKELDGGPCPCETLGGVESYGAGKPGSNGVPELSALWPPVPGEDHVLSLTNALVGASPVLVWGFTPAATGFDEGELLIADLHLVSLPVVSLTGAVGVGWDVPDDLGVCGLDLYAQVLFIDPGAGGPFHTAQTNGLRLTIGY